MGSPNDEDQFGIRGKCKDELRDPSFRLSVSLRVSSMRTQADNGLRGDNYPRPKYKQHPLDCSVMKYTGHEVLRTLIRCHFSPAETTGQQYIYSGSSDGRIHVRCHCRCVMS